MRRLSWFSTGVDQWDNHKMLESLLVFQSPPYPLTEALEVMILMGVLRIIRAITRPQRRGECVVYRGNSCMLLGDYVHFSSTNASCKMFSDFDCRKTTPRWTDQVRVSTDNGLEGHHDDGFSWRKYGQKDILGAKYPRWQFLSLLSWMTSQMSLFFF